MNAHALLVVGELCADIVVELDAAPRFGQHEHVVPATTVTLGSSSAITACGTAALGTPTSMVGVVGDDLLGHFVLDQLRAREVDVSACVVDADLPTGSSTILTLPDGDRSILTALGSIGRVRSEHVPSQAIDRCGHVHVGSYFLQYDLQPQLPAFFADCRRRGKTTSVDPNFDPREEWDGGITDLLPHADVFFCNEDEARHIAGAETLDEAVDWFRALLPTDAVLVVKSGPEGANVYQGATERHHVDPPVDDRPLVDTVGAGDSLAAGFLTGYVRGDDLRRCLTLGVHNGTASTRAAGGTAGQLRMDDLDATY